MATAISINSDAKSPPEPDRAAVPSEKQLFAEEPAVSSIVPSSVDANDSYSPNCTKRNLNAVAPSDCGCGGKKNGGSQQKVFALGKLSFDYGTRSRRVYFANKMTDARLIDAHNNTIQNPNIDDAANLYQYLTQRPRLSPEPHYTILNGPQFTQRTDVTAIQWILTIDETPIYAIAPAGAFAFEIYDLLVAFLKDTFADGAERISVPGMVVGETTLFTGEIVPVIQPDARGMFSWKKSLLVEKAGQAADASKNAMNALDQFLSRVYEQTKNLGVTSQERALNFAATDALMLQFVFKDVNADPLFKNLELDTFTVTKSPICRADFDCWDVTVIFYDPDNLQRARRARQFTVDVSDVLPIMVSTKFREFSLR